MRGSVAGMGDDGVKMEGNVDHVVYDGAGW